MTQDKISDMARQIGQFDNRLVNVESSSKEILQEVRGFAESVHELVKEQAVANANYTHQSDINKRMFSEIKEVKAETRANSRYIDTNKNMDEIIEFARKLDEDSDFWEMLYAIADERLESEKDDPDYVPWSERE